jgi:hypothetical protein
VHHGQNRTQETQFIIVPTALCALHKRTLRLGHKLKNRRHLAKETDGIFPEKKKPHDIWSKFDDMFATFLRRTVSGQARDSHGGLTSTKSGDSCYDAEGSTATCGGRHRTFEGLYCRWKGARNPRSDQASLYNFPSHVSRTREGRLRPRACCMR